METIKSSESKIINLKSAEVTATLVTGTRGSFICWHARQQGHVALAWKTQGARLFGAMMCFKGHFVNGHIDRDVVTADVEAVALGDISKDVVDDHVFEEQMIDWHSLKLTNVSFTESCEM